jgi:hypothetical protein
MAQNAQVFLQSLKLWFFGVRSREGIQDLPTDGFSLDPGQAWEEVLQTRELLPLCSPELRSPALLHTSLSES